MVPLRAVLAVALSVTVPAVAHAKCRFARVAELPVTMAGLRPTVPVTIDGKPALLLADSGAFYSFLTIPGARQMGLTVSTSKLPPGFMVMGATGASGVGVARVKTFGIGNSTVPNVEFLVNGGEIGGGAVGLLGQNILGAFDVEYDLANGVIRLFKATDCATTSLAYWAGTAPLSMIPMKRREGKLGHVEADVTINGVKVSAMFDTGASTSVLSLAGARRVGLRPDTPGVTQAGMSSGVTGRPVISYIGPVKSFEIGGIRVNNTRLRFADFTLGDNEMLIGDDFFLSTRVLFAYSQNTIYFTYNGGRMFDLRDMSLSSTRPASGAAPVGPEPADADGHARRGAALLARGDSAAALADLDRAVQLAPDNPDYRLRRAEALLAAKRPDEARAEVEAAAARAPDHAPALIQRAFLAWDRGKGDAAKARADLDRAAAALPDTSGLTVNLGSAYQAIGLYDRAVAQYSRWLAHHGEDPSYPQVLNNRCWARALGGIELEAALTDCNSAVRRSRRAAGFLDSRGLVLVRLGRYAEAVRDYDAALAAVPGMAWSLYGRGVARTRLGQAAEGAADLKAAATADPDLPAFAKRIGVEP